LDSQNYSTKNGFQYGYKFINKELTTAKNTKPMVYIIPHESVFTSSNFLASGFDEQEKTKTFQLLIHPSSSSVTKMNIGNSLNNRPFTKAQETLSLGKETAIQFFNTPTSNLHVVNTLSVKDNVFLFINKQK